MNLIFVASMSMWLGFVALAIVATLAMRARSADGNPAAHMSKLDPPSMDEIRALVPYVHKVLKSRGVPERDRWDVVQGVLIGAWEAIKGGRYRPGPDPAASLRAWIGAIARYQAANYRRSAQCRWEQIMDSDEMPHQRQRNQPDELLEDQEDHQFVNEQLACPGTMESVLIAHDLEGIGMTEMAKDRRVPLSTLYRWRAMALESLRMKARRREPS